MKMSIKLRVWSTLLLLVVCTSMFAQDKADHKILGKWNYKASEAPYGYQEGMIDVKHKDGKIMAVVTTISTSFTINDIKYDKEKKIYKSSFYADGADVEMILKEPSKDILEGTAEAQGMNMTVKCTRSKTKDSDK